MSFEKFDRERATIFALVLLAVFFFIAAYFVSLPARSQAIEFGPGGVYVNPMPNHHRNWGSTCEELRLACQYKSERGEEGMGNCRRYRSVCRREF